MNVEAPRWVKVLAVTVSVATLLSGAKCADSVAGRRAPAHFAVLDPFTTPAYAVQEVLDRGQQAYCLLRVGIYEPDRPDAARLVPGIAGTRQPGAEASTVGVANPTPGGAMPLDPGRVDLILAVLDDRLALCAAKRFEGAVLTDIPVPWLGQDINGENLSSRMQTLARRHGLVAVLATSASSDNPVSPVAPPSTYDPVSPTAPSFS